MISACLLEGAPVHRRKAWDENISSSGKVKKATTMSANKIDVFTVERKAAFEGEIEKYKDLDDFYDSGSTTTCCQKLGKFWFRFATGQGRR